MVFFHNKIGFTTQAGVRILTSVHQFSYSIHRSANFSGFGEINVCSFVSPYPNTPEDVSFSKVLLWLGDCPMFRRFYVQKILYSENICLKGSMFRRSYLQKVLSSEGPMLRRSYVQKIFVQKVLYSECSMFRRSYIQIYLEGPIFRKFCFM